MFASRTRHSLASNFGRGAHMLRMDRPLADDEIRRVAPSIFAEEAHHTRSERYAYIPTGQVLKGLQEQGFQPFMVCQTRTRKEDRTDFTKHMIRLRHASQINATEANEIILLNSHDGTSSYHMMAGCFRFVCANGLVIGDTTGDVRVRHSGQVMDNVIEGAFEVLKGFETVTEQRETMKDLRLNADEREVFAHAALAYRYDEGEHRPIQAHQLLTPRRREDRNNDLWTTFNTVQENMIRGGLQGRNAKNNRTTTRAVTGMDQDVKLNRALWVLAESMRQLQQRAA